MLRPLARRPGASQPWQQALRLAQPLPYRHRAAGGRVIPCRAPSGRRMAPGPLPKGSAWLRMSREVNRSSMPLSGEAIRVMNLVDDVATTMRRMLSLVPSLSPEERKRVGEYLGQSQPNAEAVQKALAAE